VTTLMEALKRAGLIKDEDIVRVEEETRRKREEASRSAPRERPALVVEGFGNQREGSA